MNFSVSNRITLIALLSILALTCAPSPSAKKASMARDPHSFSNHDQVVVRHLDLDLAVDFEQKQLRGKAILTIDNLAGVDTLFLDTRDLNIEKVTRGETEEPASFLPGEPVKYLGQSLAVSITPKTSVVSVYYSTKPEAAALQWLSPAQTAGGKKPFLLTQSQAILARTWVPCQDNPAVRMTYNARITTPPGMLALMSAENSPEIRADGVYEFKMPQPIPSYLLALTVGDIAFKPISNRCGIYAEPAVLEKAAYEFADTEKMIVTAEALYGPYRWGRYDMIVLPPSFPFGGMENPRLTFLTPTVIAGDRSLVAVVAHELAHSWSGNLVTNASWGDFWLNEGFTRYFEQRILESMYGRQFSEMQALLAFQDLQKEVATLGDTSADTHLFLNLDGRDPDDAVNDIPYEKGYFLLRKIEETVGRERWDAFLRSYFDGHAFQSITTEDFLGILRDSLFKGNPEVENAIALDSWVFGPGIPSNHPVVTSDAFTIVEQEANKWIAGAPAASLATSGWTTQEWMHFLRKLPKSMTPQQMKNLDTQFGFSKSGNSEILHEWFLHVIKNNYTPAYPALEKFLTSVGRRKFLKPLYTELAKTPDGLAFAKRVYKSARPGYHAVSVNTVDGILKWE